MGDDEVVAAIKHDHALAPIDTATRALLDFAVRITRDAKSSSQAAIDELRAHGFDDAAILDAVQIIGFFNYYNRMVDALGVEPEDFMVASAGDDDCS